MKMKKVSEYPLPDGDGKQLYLVEWYSRYRPDVLNYNITTDPHNFNWSDSTATRFCEFNPDEIEPAEYNEKWLTDKEHKMKMDLERINREILDHRRDEIESAEVQAYDVSEQFKNLNAPYLLRDLHDEIESSDDESNVTTDSNEIGDYNLDKIFHSALRSSVKIVEPKEPSWEEKFRWKTARDLLRDHMDHGFNVKDAIKHSIATTAILIAELKLGKE